jgi:hypothetical protein
MKTGWPPGLLQDDERKLSRWLASRPDALYQLRKNMTEITRFEMDMDGSMEPSEHGEWVRYEDAQRTWVGLTDDEISHMWRNSPPASHDFARAIEAKLKERNHG